MATDRRRINPPPPGGANSTVPPTYCRIARPGLSFPPEKRERQREADQLRRLFLQTQTIPTATGSAYLELCPSSTPKTASPPHGSTPAHPPATLKLSSTVHIAPLPHSRNTAFAPNAVLTTSVKISPFATPSRRSRTVAANLEREIGARLETALSGVILGDRWSKMSVQVGVLILETDAFDLHALMADSDNQVSLSAAAAGLGRGLGGPLAGCRETPGLVVDSNTGKRSDGSLDLSIANVSVRPDNLAFSSSTADWALMSLLSGCITVASAALADSGIDCVDIPAGGVAAIVLDPSSTPSSPSYSVVLDPHPSEHDTIQSACLVAYLPSRDEITDIWIRGDPNSLTDSNATVRLPRVLWAENGSQEKEEGDAMKVDDGASTPQVSTDPFDDLLNAACVAALGAQSVVREALGSGLVDSTT